MTALIQWLAFGSIMTTAQDITFAIAATSSAIRTIFSFAISS
jgi:hypothetical protein